MDQVETKQNPKKGQNISHAANDSISYDHLLRGLASKKKAFASQKKNPANIVLPSDLFSFFPFQYQFRVFKNQKLMPLKMC